MARGRISKIEERGIVALFEEGKTIEYIVEQSGRPKNTINKIIDKHAVKKTTTEPTSNTEHITKISKLVLSRLMSNGIEKVAAGTRINKVLNGLSIDIKNTLTEEDLYQAALKTMTGSDLFINKSVGNREGMAILTKAASEQGDSVVKPTPPKHPALFQIFPTE